MKSRIYLILNSTRENQYDTPTGDSQTDFTTCDVSGPFLRISFSTLDETGTIILSHFTEREREDQGGYVNTQRQRTNDQKRPGLNPGSLNPEPVPL